MASFFAKNYPEVDPGKYWNWLLMELCQKKLDINPLKPEDLDLFFNRINEIGDLLYDVGHRPI